MPRFSDDILSGFLFIALAAFFGITAFNTLEIGSFQLMGPGLFPIVVSILLAAIGVGVMFTGRTIDEQPKHLPIPKRAILFVIGAPIVFAMSVRSLGLVAALVLVDRHVGRGKSQDDFHQRSADRYRHDPLLCCRLQLRHRPDGSALRLAAAIRHVIRATAA